PEGSPLILSPGQIVVALNQALKGNFADQDGRRITLTSQRTGGDSKITIEPAPSNHATPAVFGLAVARSYVGADDPTARLHGVVNLSAGVDLRERRHLTLEIDGQRLADIDCAAQGPGKDPAATMLGDIIPQINAAAQKVFKTDVAGEVEGHLFI